METKVVNIYKESYDVYMGRKGKYGNGYFGNPYEINSKRTREDVIQIFELYFSTRLETDPEFKKAILSLKGKKLGCFCSPKGCHGDVIKEFLDRQ